MAYQYLPPIQILFTVPFYLSCSEFLKLYNNNRMVTLEDAQ